MISSFLMKMRQISADLIPVRVVLLVLLFGPGTAFAQRPMGTDVSSYQGPGINWTTVKNDGVSFAWTKATEGTYLVDADFATNETKARNAGVLIGAYHFARPSYDPNITGANSADTEAQFFWNTAGNYIVAGGGYLVPMLDWEDTDVTGVPSLTETTMSEWVNEWCNDVSNYAMANGVMIRPVVYTGTWYSEPGTYPGLNSTVTIWPSWIAEYPDCTTTDGETYCGSPTPQTSSPGSSYPWNTWNIWQYGDTNWSGGDADVFNGTTNQFVQLFLVGATNAPIGATLYWDPGGATAPPGSGGSGNWNGSTSNWWFSGSSDSIWPAVADNAVFAGTAGTVTLAANLTADGLTFDTTGYIIGGSDTLILGNPGSITVPSGVSASIRCVLGGVGYNLTGGGTLTLNNAGNYSGSETVLGPNTILAVATDHDVGNDGVTLNLAVGGIYRDNDTTSGDQFLLPGCAIALGSGGGIFENPNANLFMTNYITGPGSLSIIGTTYTLTLTDAGNNYSGGTFIQSGTLKANAAGTMGSASAPLTVSGGILDLGGASHTAGTVTISGGTIQDGTLTGGSFAGQSGTVSAILAGNAIMTKTTSGTLILGAANTYLGNTVINAGTLALGRAGAINSSPLVSIAAGATFDVSTISSYNFSGGTTLSANGTSSAASIKGGTTVNLGSAPIDLTYDGLHPALTISQGTLVLNGNNFIVNGSPLAGGIAYPIVQQVNGNISSFGSFAVSGTAIGAPGTSATISVVGGAVVLTITDLTTITLSSLSPSVYGQAASFTATVSPSPPGGTVQFYDNGVALGNPVAINAGAASYSTNTLSVGVHPITASYSGTVGYAASSTANSSTQQVTLPPNSIPVTISGTALLANGTVQMNFTGVPGYNYVIEGTTSLSPPISWTSLGTNTADINGVFNFIDLGATNFNGRYYRSAVQ